MEVDAEWVRKLKNNANCEAQRRDRHQNSKIFRVFKVIRDVKPEAYDPVIVSLGPYHHHEHHLQAMNQLKWFLLNKLLEKSHEKNLENYIILIKEKETKVRDTYSELPIDMLEDQFVEMMLLDCVFVIMILWFWKNEGLKAIKDPIFRRGQRILILLARDMLLLENQLPFFLLEALFDKAFPNSRPGRLKSWISQFFSRFLGNEHTLPNLDNVTTIHHILHLFYLCIVSNYKSRPREDEKAKEKEGRFPSATRLKETGIKFRRKKTNLLGITFKKGVLEIPQFEVDDDTDIIWRNLIVLEQHHNEDITIAGDPFTTYVFFLSRIIHTAADVEILLRNNIISNNLRNNEEVAHLFNKLCEEAVVGTSKCYLSQAFKEVSEHSSSKCNRWLAILTQKHCGNPWLIISFVAVLWLFTSPIVQLVYTIKTYNLNLKNYSHGKSR